MKEERTDRIDAENSTTPFDDFSQRSGGAGRRRLHLAPLAEALRVLSGAAMVLAFVSAAAIIALDALEWVRPDAGWRVKSALPLIAIGLSYALLQFTLPRTRTEFCLGLAVSLGFVLWGGEQYLPRQRIASLVDDVVVFLFVLDLSVVIRGQLRQSMGRRAAGTKGP